jgi:hypothetical protein
VNELRIALYAEWYWHMRMHQQNKTRRNEVQLLDGVRSRLRAVYEITQPWRNMPLYMRFAAEKYLKQEALSDGH